jgi:hypothetical protein
MEPHSEPLFFRLASFVCLLTRTQGFDLSKPPQSHNVPQRIHNCESINNRMQLSKSVIKFSKDYSYLGCKVQICFHTDICN